MQQRILFCSIKRTFSPKQTQNAPKNSCTNDFFPKGIQRSEVRDDAYVSRIIRFTLLAPEIIHAVLTGKINKSISTEKLKQSLPILWEDQKKMFDIE